MDSVLLEYRFWTHFQLLLCYKTTHEEVDLSHVSKIKM